MNCVIYSSAFTELSSYDFDYKWRDLCCIFQNIFCFLSTPFQFLNFFLKSNCLMTDCSVWTPLFEVFSVRQPRSYSFCRTWVTFSFNFRQIFFVGWFVRFCLFFKWFLYVCFCMHLCHFLKYPIPNHPRLSQFFVAKRN